MGARSARHRPLLEVRYRCFGKPEIKRHTLNVSHYDAKLEEAIVGGRITAVTAAEKARLSEVDNGYRQLVKLIPEAVKMAEENNDKEAIASARMWTIKIDEAIEVLIKTKLEAAAQSQKQAQELYGRTRNYPAERSADSNARESSHDRPCRYKNGPTHKCPLRRQLGGLCI